MGVVSARLNIYTQLQDSLECQACVQEEDARWFFQQLMVGLDYCHRMGVVNRDIKLENTLLDASPKPLVKITDFGYCKASNDSLPKSKVGTPGYTGGLCQPRHCPPYLLCETCLLLHASILTSPLQSAALPLVRLPRDDVAYLLLGKCCLFHAAVL